MPGSVADYGGQSPVPNWYVVERWRVGVNTVALPWPEGVPVFVEINATPVFPSKAKLPDAFM